MARIAFILLCHKDPESIIQQAQQLTARGDFIAIHFDARAPAADFAQIRQALRDNPNVTFATRRIKCGWGEWSLVQASLNAVEAAVTQFPQATHFYMVSGDCMATKSAKYAQAFLDNHDQDFIESFDFFDSDWIKTGIKKERLIYRHYVNERSHKRLFYTSMELQKRLGLKRNIPADLRVMIGSQWWCLRRPTIEQILEFTRTRRDVMRFFATTWIPDETFFQTLVRHLVPHREISSRTLTFLMFSDYGMPVTFYNDHYEMLLGQDCLFARKISPEAQLLKERLGALYASDRTDFVISNEGRSLFRFLTGRGRIGRRFAPRFWEAESTVGRGRELLIVACKKWHVAKRLLGAIQKHTDIATIEYLFDEEDTRMPDLGGIEQKLGKRARHRRAMMRMIFDHFGTDRLIMCLDTSKFDLIQDFYADRARTRLLEIECTFTDDYLVGHAQRVGLAGENSSQRIIDQLLPTIRNDVHFEHDRIRDAELPDHWIMRETASTEENAAALQSFLDVPRETAYAVASTDHLFTD